MRSMAEKGTRCAVASAVLASLVLGVVGTRAAAETSTPNDIKADIQGVVVRLADGDGAHTTLQLPGERYVSLDGPAAQQAPTGSRVTASVEVPPAVVAAAREERSVPSVDGTQVLVDRAQLAAAHEAGSAAVNSPLARATAAQASTTHESVTAARVTVLATAAAGYTRARHDVTVAVVVPRGVRGTSATPAQVRAQLAGASAYWSEESRGGITFSATTITAPYTSAYGCRSDNRSTWAYDMWAEAAKRTGFVSGPNKHLVLSFPATATATCNYGLATYGEGPNSGGSALVSDTAWPVLAHELGHNLGLGHAQTLQCNRADVDLTRLPPGCSIVEYGNPWSVMSQSARDRAGSLSTVQAARIGLLTPPDIVDVTSGTRTVKLNAVATQSGVRSIRVTDPVSKEQYFVEYRTRTGRDRLLYEDVPNGVRILKIDPTAWENRGSVLLDMTPTGSATDKNRPLAVGKTFVSRTGAVTVKVNAAGTTATVTAAAARTAASTQPVATPPAALPTPRLGVPAVNATGSAVASAHIGWSGAVAGSRYDVRVRTVGFDGRGRATYSAARAWLTGTARGGATLKASYGSVVQVSARLRSATATGAWTGWHSTVFATDAGARGAAKSGRWQTLRNPAYYAGTLLATSINRASVQRAATPSSRIRVIGTRHARGSVAHVYVDGRLRASVSTYAARTVHRQVLATVSVPAGRHVVKVVNVASRTRPTLLLDAVAYER